MGPLFTGRLGRDRSDWMWICVLRSKSESLSGKSLISFIQTEDGWFTQNVVCNYAEGGNMVGGVMYETGAGCSNCPAGTSCDATFDALCA